MKIMVTGANGFLGSHVVKNLLKKGDEILAISLHADRLASVFDQIQFSNCSMNRITSIEDRILSFNPETIIHCAWDGGNNYLSTQSPNQFYKNIPGLVDLMEIIKRGKIPHFVGIGSGAEYGDKRHIITEQTREIPINLYGVAKLMAKMYTEQYCKNENIKWTWIRPFYTYGPDDVPTRLIPRTIISCIKKEEVLLNECDISVDYLYIDDFVSAVFAAMKTNQGHLFNVCSGKSNSAKSIVKQIGEITNNSQNLRFGALPERNNQPSTILGSQVQLELLTNWRPSVSLEEGLRKTIEFYKKV